MEFRLFRIVVGSMWLDNRHMVFQTGSQSDSAVTVLYLACWLCSHRRCVLSRILTLQSQTLCCILSADSQVTDFMLYLGGWLCSHRLLYLDCFLCSYTVLYLGCFLCSHRLCVLSQILTLQSQTLCCILSADSQVTDFVLYLGGWLCSHRLCCISGADTAVTDCCISGADTAVTDCVVSRVLTLQSQTLCCISGADSAVTDFVLYLRCWHCSHRLCVVS